MTSSRILRVGEMYYKVMLLISLFCFGWLVGMYLHPYEMCERKYDNPEDVSECVWIMENN